MRTRRARYSRIGALRTTAAFVTWLFRIVERECRRLLFLRPKEQAMDWSLIEAKPAPDIPQDLRLDLSRAIAALAPPYRDVLLLRDVDGLTAPETALQLGLSLETVKTRLRRAREFLRENLIASVTQHLLRSLAAALLLYSAFHVAEIYPFWIMPALIGTFLLMRGCPSCWLVGLVETIAKRRGRTAQPRLEDHAPLTVIAKRS